MKALKKKQIDEIVEKARAYYDMLDFYLRITVRDGDGEQLENSFRALIPFASIHTDLDFKRFLRLVDDAFDVAWRIGDFETGEYIEVIVISEDALILPSDPEVKLIDIPLED